MPKRMKVFVSVLVAVLLLTVGGVATVMADGGSTATVMADGGSTATDNETGRNGFQARVAGILGIPQEDLVAAFGQAREEQREQIRNQATDNCSAYLECPEKFRERWAERHEMWQEKGGQASMRSRHMFTALRGCGRLGQGQPAE